MNYRYFDDNHTIQVYSNGLKIKINYDSYTGINFNCEEDAVQWLNKYLYGDDNKFIDLKIIIENNILKITNMQALQLEENKDKFIDILKDDYDYIIRERNLENDGTVDLSDLPNGKYFYDINIEQETTLFNVERAMFEVRDGNIKLLNAKE